MRKIKLRYWDELNKIFIDGDEIIEVLNEVQGVITVELEPVIHTALEQFTGLLDKDGKEIYEGDIVYLAGYGNYVVEWPFIQLYESAWEKDVEGIIGNIHENPELLENG